MNFLTTLLPWLILLAVGIYLTRDLWRGILRPKTTGLANLDHTEEPVALRMAWRWECPDCGHVNYHLGHQLKPGDLDGMEVVDQNDEPMVAEDFVIQPTEVWCMKCEGRHRTVEP